jgi:WD40 repeat protein
MINGVALSEHVMDTEKEKEMSRGVNCFTCRDYVKCVNIVAWSPDGHYLAAGSSDGTVRIWETDTWKAVGVFDTRTRRVANSQEQSVIEAVYMLSWSLDGKAIHLSPREQWNIQTGEVMPTTALQLARKHATFAGYYARIPKVHQEYAGPAHWFFHRDAYILVNCMDESPDRQQIAYGGRDHAIWIWNVNQLKMVQSYTPHAGSVMCVAWSPDGSQIASGSYDTSMRIYEVGTGEERGICTGHENVVLDLCWSPDGQQVASSSWDKTARIWDALTGECVYRYQGHSGPVNSIAWSPDRRYLASGSWDHTVQVWEAR